jgi:hypothetical protein
MGMGLLKRAADGGFGQVAGLPQTWSADDLSVVCELAANREFPPDVMAITKRQT